MPPVPPQMNPNAAAAFQMFTHGIINEFLQRFPSLGILDPNASVTVQRCNVDGEPTGLQVNTWAQLLAEHTDTMKTLIEAVDELTEAMEKKRRR